MFLKAGKKNTIILICVFSVFAVAAGLYLSAVKRPEPVITGVPDKVRETVRELRAVIRLEVPELIDFIDADVPEEGKSESFMEALNLLRESALKRVRVFIFTDEKLLFLPVAVFYGSEAADFGRWLDTKGSAFFEKREEEGVYAIRTEAFPKADRYPFPPEDYRIRLFSGYAVACPVSLSDLWASGVEEFMNSALLDFSSRAEFPGSFISFASRIKEPEEGWKERILEHPSVKETPQARMVMGVGIGILEGLMEPLKKIDALALAAGPSDAGRKIKYIQHFRDPDAGAAMVKKAAEGLSEEEGTKGFIRQVLNLLNRANAVQKHIGYEDGNLILDLSWKAEDDEAVSGLLAEAALGHIFRSMEAAGFDASPGYVPTIHTEAPNLKKRLSAESIREALEDWTDKGIFPSTFWSYGEAPRMDMELDPVEFPNSALATLEYRVLSASSPDGKDVLGNAVNEYKKIFTNTISIPVRPGIPAEELDKAVLALRLEIASEIELFDFNKKDAIKTEKTAGGITATLNRLEKDIAGVSVTLGERVRIFAFDEEGQALSAGESFSSGLSQTVRFHGLIHEVRVAVVRKFEHQDFRITVDMNRGKGIGIPAEPDETVPVRYARMKWKKYPDLSKRELSDLTVLWMEGDEGSWVNGPTIEFPKNPVVGSAKWEVGFFGKDSPVLIEGRPVTQPMNIYFDVDREALKTAHAAFGTAEITVESGIVRLDFSKTSEGAPVKRRLPDGTEVVAVFEKNCVTVDVRNVKLIQHAAFSAEGKPLRMGKKGYGPGPRRFFCFGIPMTFAADFATETLRRKIPFDIVKRPVDDKAYAEYKSFARVFPEVKSILARLRDARHESRQTLRSDIAQLYYACGADHRPLRLISKKIAHSDPAGASLFGYSPSPHLGYYFTVSKGTVSEGRCIPYPEAEPVSLKLEKGTVLTSRYKNSAVALMALPEKNGMPAFCLMMGKIYMKAWDEKSEPCTPSSSFGALDGWVSAGTP